MGKMTGSVVGWLALAGMVVAFAGAARAAAADAKAVAKGNNAFAVELYAKLREQKGNLFLSPYSVSTALAMTYAGARGQTAAQMAKVLHFDPEAPQLHTAYGSLMASLSAPGKPGGHELSIANALWIQRGTELLKDYLDLTKSAYGAAPYEADFKSDPEAARKTINEWVEKQTRDKIQDLIPRGMLDELARLVLTNAIYFKGTWESVFKDDSTHDGPFALLSGEKLAVPMMHQTAHFGYLETDAFQVLVMPYKGHALSMVVFLPKAADGLPQFESSLTAENLEAWLPRLGHEKVIVTFPKFKMTAMFRLADPLKAMGMADAFSQSAADFSGMTGGKDLFIQAVVHKAFVDVNERGTEAAAATAVIMAPTAMAPVARPTPVFTADHPFLFLIRHNPSGCILFLSRVLNPRG